MTAIFWGNLFRFHPAMIDQSYDGTSDGLKRDEIRLNRHRALAF
jgi:hypothetical protein